MKKSKGIISKYTSVSIITVLVIVLAWWFIVDVLHLFTQITLPSPQRVVQTLIQKFYMKAPDGSTMLQHIGESLKITLMGYLMGCLIGIPLGILMAWYKPIDMFVRPIFDLLKPVPGIAWIPVMVVFFGIGLMSKVMVIFLTVLISTIINAYAGIKQTKDVHLWVGQTFGATRFQMLIRVGIPTALPFIMTSLRIALAAAWLAIVAAEMLGASRGLGFMISQARAIQRSDIIIAGMIVISIISAVLNRLLLILERWVVKGVKVNE